MLGSFEASQTVDALNNVEVPDKLTKGRYRALCDVVGCDRHWGAIVTRPSVVAMVLKSALKGPFAKCLAMKRRCSHVSPHTCCRSSNECHARSGRASLFGVL